jgi:Transposase
MDSRTRYGGVDWASRSHAICIVDDRGEPVEQFTVEHTEPGLRTLGRRLVKAGVNQVAIERPDGPVIEALRRRHESSQRGLLLAPDPGAQLSVDEIALVDLAAALPPHRDLGRRERCDNLLPSHQFADEHGNIAAVGLDDPQRTTWSAGELGDPLDQRFDRHRLVGDPFAQDLVARGHEHHDPVAVPAWVDTNDQALRHPPTSELSGLRIHRTRRAAART